MNRRTLISLVLTATLLTAANRAWAGKGYSSGGGRSYSSGGRSSSSSSSGSRSSSSSAGKSYSSGGGRSFTSGGGSSSSGGSSSPSRAKSAPTGATPASTNSPTRSYTSSSGKTYSSGTPAKPVASTATQPSRGTRPQATYNDVFGRSRPLATNRPQAERLHTQLTPATFHSRPQREAQTYAPYLRRPIVYYNDPYHPYFWWWLMERDRHQRALWTYHHRPTMDQARYQDLLARDQALAAEVRDLETRGVARDPTFVPRDDPLWQNRRLLGGLLAAGPNGLGCVINLFALPPEPASVDLDLMFTDNFTTSAYNPVETAEGGSFSTTHSTASTSGQWGGWLCLLLPLGLIIVTVALVSRAQRR